MTVKTINQAWEIAKEFISDYQKDEESSSRAGYSIYRSESEYYNYICDLGNRLEVNLKQDNKTVNIWVKDDEQPTATEASEMHEYQLTIGLYDKDTEKQETTTDRAKQIISEILISKYEIFAFTMIDCSGVYKMSSTNRIVFEPSIRIEIATDEPIDEKINAIIETIKDREHLNQESIMIKHGKSNIQFR